METPSAKELLILASGERGNGHGVFYGCLGALGGNRN